MIVKTDCETDGLFYSTSYLCDNNHLNIGVVTSLVTGGGGGVIFTLRRKHEDIVRRHHREWHSLAPSLVCQSVICLIVSHEESRTREY